MSVPAFSIVVCNRDYAEFVGAAIESCLAQDYPPEAFEIIVVDDGSADGSSEVISGWAERSRQVRAIRIAHAGQAAALRAGVERARHDLVCFLDSDDLFAPRKLRTVADRLNRLGRVPEAFFLCHDALILDEQGTGRAPRTLFELIAIDAKEGRKRLADIDHHFGFANPCGQVMSRALAAAILGRLPADDWRICADGPIAHAAALAAGGVHYLPEPLASYRIHGRNGFVKLEDGRFSTKQDWRELWPRQLSFLSGYADSLALGPRERAERSDYLARMERLVAAAEPR